MDESDATVAEPRRGRPSDGTRERLIGAALDAFGREGFDAASTRAIAKAADANLAAIPYHFGGKEGLHRAVAQHIVEGVKARLAPIVEMAEPGGAMAPQTAEEAGILLHRFIDAACETLIANPDAARWAPFILREQMAPSPSFDVLYDGFMGRMHRLITAIYAMATGRDAEAPETIVRVFGVLGQLLVFRLARAAVERRLGWDGYGPDEVALIRGMLHEHLDALLMVETRQ